jgi:hypothetical protein
VYLVNLRTDCTDSYEYAQFNDSKKCTHLQLETGAFYQFPIAFPNLVLGIDKMHTPTLMGGSNLTISIFRITKPNPPLKKFSSRRALS